MCHLAQKGVSKTSRPMSSVSLITTILQGTTTKLNFLLYYRGTFNPIEVLNCPALPCLPRFCSVCSMPSGSLSSFGTDVATSLNINGTAANTSSFTLDARAPSGSAKLMVTDLASRAVDVNTTGYVCAPFLLICALCQYQNFSARTKWLDI